MVIKLLFQYLRSHIILDNLFMIKRNNILLILKLLIYLIGKSLIMPLNLPGVIIIYIIFVLLGYQNIKKIFYQTENCIEKIC